MEANVKWSQMIQSLQEPMFLAGTFVKKEHTPKTSVSATCCVNYELSNYICPFVVLCIIGDLYMTFAYRFARMCINCLSNENRTTVIYIYIYIYICVCACVRACACVCARARACDVRVQTFHSLIKSCVEMLYGVLS